MSSSSAHSETSDDSDVMRLAARRLPRLLMASALVGGLAYLISSMIAPSYESEAQVSIQAKGRNDAMDAATRMDPAAVNTHVQAMLSPELGRTIVKDMDLASRKEFNRKLGAVDRWSGMLRLFGFGGPRSGETEEDQVLSHFYKNLAVYSPKESRLIGIQFTSIDKDLAAAVPNKLAEMYRNSLADQTKTEITELQTVLEPKIAALKQEISKAEREIEAFRGKSDIFGGQSTPGLNNQQLAELTAELSKVKAERSEADARAKSSRELLKSGSAEALPDVQKSVLVTSLIQQRVALERRVSENAVANLPGHPVSKKLQAELEGLRKQIAAEIAKVIDSIDKEAKVASFREDSVQKRLKEMKENTVTKGPNEAELRTLEASARSKRAELERLENQFEANRIKADSRAVGVEAQIVSKAQPSSMPVSPNKTGNALFAATATFLLGLAGIVTRGLISGVAQQTAGASGRSSAASAASRPGARGRRSSDMPNLEGESSSLIEGRKQSSDAPSALATAAAAATGAVALSAKTIDPVLRADAPLSRADAPNAARDVKADSSAPSVAKKPNASLDDIAARLQAKAAGPLGFRTLIAGDAPSIGEGVEAINLSKALAAKGKAVLLLDWAPRGKSIVGGIGLKVEPGLTGLLDGRATFEDTIRAVPGSDVHMVTAGAPMANPAGLEDAQKLNMLLDALDEAYDHIVVACPLEDARHLFEATEGRFDAGITISETKRRASATADTGDMFLGFEVADIELATIERPAASQDDAKRIVRPTLPSDRINKVMRS
jgi:polysaccharide biosynthesis transport protein